MQLHPLVYVIECTGNHRVIHDDGHRDERLRMDRGEQCIVDHGDERRKRNWKWHGGVHRRRKHIGHCADRHADDCRPDGDDYAGGRVQFQHRTNCAERVCGWRSADSGRHNDQRLRMDRREQQHNVDHRHGGKQRNRERNRYLQCCRAHLDDPAHRDVDDRRADPHRHAKRHL
jgi:hypothetical protein